ncbi:GNAT family N-acetyltransferase [Streptomyces sp. PT12]|uniref:GNAT family N-acetyltransferase n=1 Tax=Streptomyces sp. PT12 TaxID=1510197 RepID=UPI00215D3231|nr:GNAT family N-acetyltransferase [Streptomyces sp. PT12]
MLSHIVVTSSARSSGIGAVLLHQFVSDAAAAGCARDSLVTAVGPDGAGAYYERHGWLPRGETLTPEGSRLATEEMVAVGMWREGCPATREDLRRVEINHIDFDGEVSRGVLVVNADVADSVVRIFTRLFDERFPIRRMRPVEEYEGDNNASMADDDTAAHNCRRPDQINAPQAARCRPSTPA